MLRSGSFFSALGMGTSFIFQRVEKKIKALALVGAQAPVAIHQLLFFGVQDVFLYRLLLAPDIRASEKKIYRYIKKVCVLVQHCNIGLISSRFIILYLCLGDIKLVRQFLLAQIPFFTQ